MTDAVTQIEAKPNIKPREIKPQGENLPTALPY